RVGHRLDMLATTEGHRVEGEAADGDLAAQVIGVGADLPDPEYLDAAKQQVWPRIPRPARLERRELERQPRGQRFRLDLSVDAQERHRPDAAEPAAHDLVESLDERGDVRACDR